MTEQIVTPELERLREWKKENRYTSRQLAEILEYHSGHMDKVLSGYAPISDQMRWRFLQAFPEDAAALFFNGEGNDNPA